MAKYLRYQGEFLSIKGVLWRAEILQEADRAFSVEDLTFEADEPLVIEWDGKDKHEPIQSSSATLKIESPGDRTYADLYTEEVGAIRLDIYREGVLYWQGCLDTEFYEEPYERYNLYAVTLTFSDFGVFDRLFFLAENKNSIVTLESVVLDALSRAGLTYTEENIECYTSTFLPEVNSSQPIGLKDIAVNSANFFDEEDEASTMQEVLEGFMQPLALRMIQRNGRVIIYDLNWACYNANREQISWSSDSQTLSVDKVYNNAKITFSPYAQTIEMVEEGFVGDIIETYIDLTYTIPQLYSGTFGDDDALYYVSWDLFRGYLQLSIKGDYERFYGQGFTMWLTRKNHSSNGELVYTASRTLNSTYYPDFIPSSDGTFYGTLYFFKIYPFYLSDDYEGIMLRSAKAIISENDKNYGWVQYGLSNELFGVDTTVSFSGRYTLYRSDTLRIPTLADKSKINLLVKLEVLLSAGYTPWHTEVENKNWQWSKDKSKSNDTRLGQQLNYMIVPIRLIFVTDGGTTYAWTNVDSWEDGFPDYDSGSYPTWVESLGSWVDVTTSEDLQTRTIGVLAYYPSSNLDTDGPEIIGSFGPNYQYMQGFYQSSDKLAMGTETKTIGGGQMVSLPTQEAGTVYIEILSNWCFMKYDGGRYQRTYNNEIASNITWCLMKAPSIEMVSYRPWDTSLDTDDVEYSAVINEKAKEDIELDTICGTGGIDRPTARGAFLDGEGKITLTNFLREDLYGACEELLIATLYSQYAQRHTTLSGEAYIQETDGFTLFTDAAQDSDTLFIATEILENLYQDCGDMTFVEASKDDYEPE